MTIKALYPIIKPSLLLDFANAKRLDPRAVFTRAGAATYFDDSTPPVLVTAPAGVARFDHAPVTGDKLGLLKEPQRTNLLLQSEDFSTTWQSSAPYSVDTNAAIAPDGNQTADALVVASGQSSFSFNVTRQSVTKAATATTYTHSVFCKALGATTSVRIVDFGTSTFDSASVIISLVGGSIIVNPFTLGGFSSASVAVSNFGNGWFRVSLTFTTDAGTSLTIRAFPYIGSAALVGDGTSGLYIWGAQLEEGAFSTSYIPTTTASVTRPADALSIAQGNAGQGTFLVDSTTRSGDTLITSGTTTFDATAATRQITTVAYDSTDTRRSINGAAVTSSAGTTGDADVTIASGATGHVSKVALYPQKLNDTNLQALTT